jgi:hypothetical protein
MTMATVMKSCKLCGGPAMSRRRLCVKCYNQAHSARQKQQRAKERAEYQAAHPDEPPPKPGYPKGRKRPNDVSDTFERDRHEIEIMNLSMDMNPSEAQWDRMCRRARRTSPEDVIRAIGGRP